jgi:hypothetical protein
VFILIILKSSSGRHNALQLELKDQEALVKGEVVVHKMQRAKALTGTARERAAVNVAKATKPAKAFEVSLR